MPEQSSLLFFHRWQTQEVTIYFSHVGDLDGFEGSLTEALETEVIGAVFSAQQRVLYNKQFKPTNLHFTSHICVFHQFCDLPNAVSYRHVTC